jgi:hypothetical protein
MYRTSGRRNKRRVCCSIERTLTRSRGSIRLKVSLGDENFWWPPTSNSDVDNQRHH